MDENDPFKAQYEILSNHTVNTIFDVGANTGQTTRKYRDSFPSALIYAFEPCPYIFNEFTSNFDNDSRVIPYNIAISDISGTSYLFLNKNSGTNSMQEINRNIDIDLYVNPEFVENIGKVQVPVTSLDNFVFGNNIEYIDILKMDIQGNELQALKGSLNLLRERKISMIYSEIWFVQLYEKTPMFFQLYEYLFQFGFELYDLYNKRYTSNGQIKWADAIFVNAKLRP
jgi:FkbM family methyltransferase